MSGHRLTPTHVNGFFYASTKFAVRALTEGVRSELRELKSNIRVSVSFRNPSTSDNNSKTCISIVRIKASRLGKNEDKRKIYLLLHGLVLMHC